MRSFEVPVSDGQSHLWDNPHARFGALTPERASSLGGQLAMAEQTLFHVSVEVFEAPTIERSEVTNRPTPLYTLEWRVDGASVVIEMERSTLQELVSRALLAQVVA
jgi:hypothetical protein